MSLALPRLRRTLSREDVQREAIRQLRARVRKEGVDLEIETYLAWLRERSADDVAKGEARRTYRALRDALRAAKDHVDRTPSPADPHTVLLAQFFRELTGPTRAWVRVVASDRDPLVPQRRARVGGP